ncbi:uncharacterized protein Dana_GF16622 [Drosophila ananassae]|uniref:CHK kinase-like domain-containing protein n=1 Tax=Drosophila ananassae TaxID=7217 RepID=B3M112_DROAN|nr:uncharacterized protein LOC6499417 [Drosophila ananassae]EDV43241.1 uncharacterized protein Dana_GF16622 [Drosophila ananassae]
MSTPILLTQRSQDVSVPSWVDSKDLEDVLKKEIPDFRKIESSQYKWEQQLSQPALRVQLTVQCAANKRRQVNYLIKSKETIASGLKLPIKGDFSVELFMYEAVLPALEDLYKNVEKTILFSPASFKSKQKSECLYLDYILAKGYSLATTPKGLSPTAMETVLSKLAAYHAGTACYIERNRGKIRELPKLGAPLEFGGGAGELKSLFQMKFHESLRSNDIREYEDKVKAFQKYLKAHLGSFDTKSSFNVILNGSCWPNNLVYQSDAFGNVKDPLFIDFQAAKYGPAVYDLFSLLLTAPAEKSTRFDGYLNYYHDQLLANLKLLQFQGKKPSLTDLQLDLLKYGHWGFEVATEVLPIVLAELETSDVEDLFRNPVFGHQIREILPWLENRGYFEED